MFLKTMTFVGCLAASLAILSLDSCTSSPFLPDGSIIDNPDPTVPSNPCPEGVISFQYEILPLIVSSCAYSGCHDAASAEDGVILDSYSTIMREVKPGDPNDSELYDVLFESGDDRMPPPPAAPLSSDQVNLIKTWIQQGAHETNCGTPCDAEASSFTANIFPIIQLQCLGCHSGSSPQGGVLLDSYTTIQPYVQSGALLGSIKFDAGYAAMPPSGGQMDACRIDQIEKWINEGALNN